MMVGRRKERLLLALIGFLIATAVGVSHAAMDEEVGVQVSHGHEVSPPVGAPVLPGPVRFGAYFPNVYKTPNATPKMVVLSQGGHTALVDVQLLVPVSGIAVCVQRSVVPPVEISAWTFCTSGLVSHLSIPQSEFTFNITDIEGNVPYYINMALFGDEVDTTSAQISITLSVCPGASSYTMAITEPKHCVATTSLGASGNTNFTVPATGVANQTYVYYFTVPAPNTNANEIVYGMDVTLANLPRTATQSWQFYASANMPALPSTFDFTIESNASSPSANSTFHISTPSPGLWYLVLVLNLRQTLTEPVTATISRQLETRMPGQLGAEIASDGKVVLGPKNNTPNELQYFHFPSKDGAIYLSLSVLNPLSLPMGELLPYKIFVAVNAIPGAFDAKVDSLGTNVFADWIGCSATNCTRTITLRLPAMSPPPPQALTYVVAVLPIGIAASNTSSSQFALWRESFCPFCDRGTCRTTGDFAGTCHCPSGWLLIDCALWGSNSLTPQTIVLIATAALFVVLGIAALAYFLFLKRAKMCPKKFGAEAKGYDKVINDDDGMDETAAKPLLS